MTDAQANPEVGLDEYEELEPNGEVTEIEFPEDAAPTAETVTAPTSPSTRPVKQAQSQESQIDLDTLPAFRKWKSAMDKQVADERRQREELQAQIEAREQQQLADQQRALEHALDESVDPDEQRRIVRQLADMQAAASYAAWQKWDTHVRKRVAEEGLDMTGFDPRSYSGTTGAAQFERDLATRKAAKLQAEIETYRRAADPANIAKLVQEQVAKALQGAGMNEVDTAVPSTPVNTGASWQRDLALLQQGKMSGQEFKKRWGNRS